MSKTTTPRRVRVGKAVTPVADPVPGILTRAEDDPLRPGDVVMLPDGGTASVEKIIGGDAYVVEWTKQIGRGPWIFPVADLVPVT
jgi:hypothetical protein